MKAISATFRHRGTTIEAEPIGLTQTYCDDPARAIQWSAFVRRSRFKEEGCELARLVSEIREFALPVLSASADGNPFRSLWKPGGPGSEKCMIREAIRPSTATTADRLGIVLGPSLVVRMVGDNGGLL